MTTIPPNILALLADADHAGVNMKKPKSSGHAFIGPWRKRVNSLFLQTEQP